MSEDGYGNAHSTARSYFFNADVVFLAAAEAVTNVISFGLDGWRSFCEPE
jgi:hypothetical protein